MQLREQIEQLAARATGKYTDEDFAVFGFGAKLHPPADQFPVTLLNALDGSVSQACVSEVRGTRHQSAARFVNTHNDALVFVASQDGPLTLFAWAVRESVVIGLQNLHHLIWEYGADAS